MRPATTLVKTVKSQKCVLAVRQVSDVSQHHIHVYDMKMCAISRTNSFQVDFLEENSDFNFFVIDLCVQAFAL